MEAIDVERQLADSIAVSSDSSSSSSSESEPAMVATKTTGHHHGGVQRQPKQPQLHDKDKNNDNDEAEVSASKSAISPPPPPQVPPPNQAFDEFYLRQATKEFANDLDKLRSASDFWAGSVDVLVKALGQGRACFTAEERRRVGAVQLASTDRR